MESATFVPATLINAFGTCEFPALRQGNRSGPSPFFG
jgi:hypothetical protein